MAKYLLICICVIYCSCSLIINKNQNQNNLSLFLKKFTYLFSCLLIINFVKYYFNFQYYLTGLLSLLMKALRLSMLLPVEKSSQRFPIVFG